MEVEKEATEAAITLGYSNLRELQMAVIVLVYFQWDMGRVFVFDAFHLFSTK